MLLIPTFPLCVRYIILMWLLTINVMELDPLSPPTIRVTLWVTLATLPVLVPPVCNRTNAVFLCNVLLIILAIGWFP